MRRLILPVALLAALLAILALKSPWQQRAAPRPGGDAAEGAAATGRGGADAPDAAKGEPTRAPAADDEERAHVHGVVTGAAGPLWCARVVAYRKGTDDVLAEAFTNPEGRYMLGVAVSDFDLGVEPAAGTWLVAPPRRPMVLNEGDDLEENFALGPTAFITGRVVGADGEGVAGVSILAVLPEDAGPDDAHPNTFAERRVAACRSGATGAFRLGGVKSGTYGVVVGDSAWTLVRRVVTPTDGPEQVLEVVPAIAVDLEAKDIETEAPLESFAVKVTLGDRVIFEGRGTGGVFSRRVPAERQAAWGVQVEVSAPGFVDWGPFPVAFRARQTAWLFRPRDPNTRILISFDDGIPYRGAVRVLFGWKADRPELARGMDDPWLVQSMGHGRGSSVPFERTADGAFRGAMPHGRWSVLVLAEDVFGAPRLYADLELATGKDAETKFVLPAGGILVFHPPGANPVEVTVKAEGGEEGAASSMLVEVPAEGRRIEGIPPGLYHLGYPKMTYNVVASRDPASRKLKEQVAMQNTVAWFRDVRVVAGGSEDIRLPPP